MVINGHNNKGKDKNDKNNNAYNNVIIMPGVFANFCFHVGFTYTKPSYLITM